MEKAEKESFIMSLLARDQQSSSGLRVKSPEEDSHAASFSSSLANLHSFLAASSQHQSLLPLSLFAPQTSPPPPQTLYHPQPQYGGVSPAQSLSDYASIFNHLPDLLSLDHSPSYHHLHPSPAAASSPVAPRGSRIARKRRQTLADKTRCLQKLLPWEKKMDIATMLEAAHRYVRFLQAQVAALHAMPIVASDSTGSLPVLTRGGGDGGGEVAVLSRLSRSQLLQVVVNSQVAQMRLSDLERCVFSVEQLALLNKRSVIRSAMVAAAASASGSVSGHNYYPAPSSIIDSTASASATN
ncbi:transcription factor LRL3 [Argentina anserina]|uniref:transcription factor LRL3 n=1 Tax=Argentina anserina TaxID=57926 RepID=UPI00217640A0|nr:transcription factor LRL3 [Potentilla anserina]